ncbi:MAG: tetratricopeptide repeat protein, partial [bacterium]
WLPPLALLAVNISPAAWTLAPLALGWLVFGSEPLGTNAPGNPRFAKSCFFLVLLACLCLRPQGPLGLTHSLAALGASPLLPGAFGARQGGLLLMVLAGVLVAASSWTPLGRSRAAREAFLLAIFAVLALATRDALPYFLALAAPVCAARFDILVDALPSSLRAARWPVKILVFAGLLVFVVPGVWRRLPGAERASRPDQTLDFYRQQAFDENILCPAEWTPYLAWKLAPDARFALDGRGVAAADRASELRDALQASGDYSGVLAREGVGLCWLPLGSPLAQALASSQAWQPLSFDDASVIYVPVTPAHAGLIRSLAPRGLRPGDPVQPFDATRLVEAEADLEADLARDPKMGVLYLYMARLWMARGHAAKARETLEGGIRADPGFAPNDALLASLRARLGDAADRAAARILYQRALDLEPRPDWRRALDAMGPA